MNPIVQAYDNMASKAAIFSSGIGFKSNVVYAKSDQTIKGVSIGVVDKDDRSAREHTSLSRKIVDSPTELIVTAEDTPNATAVTQVFMQQQTLNVQAGVHATLNDIAKPRKNAAATDGSNLNATVALISHADNFSSVTRKLDKRRIQSNSQQILGEKLVAFVGIPDGVKASKTNVELLGSNLEKAGTSRAVADRATTGVIKTIASPSKNNISVHKTKTSETNNVTVSNSFEALMNEQDLEDVWKEGQQVQHETNIKPRQSSATRK